MALKTIMADLEKLAAKYEADAHAIRITLRILDAQGKTKASKELPKKLVKAIAARADVTASEPATPPAKKKHTGGRQKSDTPTKYQRQVRHRRAISERLLGMFHPARASSPDNIRERLVADGMSIKDAKQAMRGIGALVRRNYLQKVGPLQYTRTERAFSVNGDSASA